MDFMFYLLSPFTWLLNFFYSVFENYGFSIICFAVVVKICLFPFSLKGKRGMIQMNMMSGRMQKLQKQYANNKEKYNEEVQRIYAEEGVNPMGGCLWSMLPLFVLLPLYAIIRQPLKYMMGLSEDEILAVADKLDWVAAYGSDFVDTGYNQLYLASMITEDTLSAVASAVGDAANVFAMNFDFFGMNLAMVPNWRIWENFTMANMGLVILVFISAATGFLFSMITMKTNKMTGASQNAQAESTNKTMMYTMPLMSLWIGFVMPAGLCVYWIANNLLSMIQEQIAGRMLKKDYEAARLAAEERERQEKIDEKERKEQNRLERARRLEEEKKGKKKSAPKVIEEKSNVNRDDSRVGMRPYARGRSYDPNRFNPQPTTEMAADSVEEVTEEGAE